VLFSLAMAAHAVAWSWIARQSTPFQALLPGVMDEQMSKRAVYFFNVKQVYLWLAGGQGLVGTAATYVSSVVPLLVYSEVLHVFKSALLFYFMFFDEVESRSTAGCAARLRSCCKHASSWLLARWCFVVLGGLALALFIADEVTGGAAGDSLSFAVLLLTLLVELGGDAALARRMVLSGRKNPNLVDNERGLRLAFASASARRPYEREESTGALVAQVGWTTTLPQMLKFYAVNQPDKTEPEIAKLMMEWEEEKLLNDLVMKYGDDPRRYPADGSDPPATPGGREEQRDHQEWELLLHRSSSCFNMNATKQTLALKGTCLLSLLSAILGIATVGDEREEEKSTVGDAKAFVLICLALIVSLIQNVFFFAAAPPNYALLRTLSILNAVFFIAAFVIVASSPFQAFCLRDFSLCPAYGVGFVFMIIGWLASMGHFAVSNNACSRSATASKATSSTGCGSLGQTKYGIAMAVTIMLAIAFSCAYYTGGPIIGGSLVWVVALAVTLAVSKVCTFSLKVHALRRVTWCKPRAAVQHRRWWRVCCACWSAIAAGIPIGFAYTLTGDFPILAGPATRSPRNVSYCIAGPAVFCFVLACDALMWSRAADRCKALAAQSNFIGAGLTSINIAIFNAKQLYLWALLVIELVQNASDDDAGNPFEQNVYLLAFVMVLHCFKSGTFSFSALAAAGSRPRKFRRVCQASLASGLALFAWTTFSTQSGVIQLSAALPYALGASFLLLAPEVLAGFYLLRMAEVAVSGRQEETSDLAAALLPARDNARDSKGGDRAHTQLGRRKDFAVYCVLVICLASVSVWQLSEVFESIPWGRGS
jgi:hypothetical protein